MQKFSSVLIYAVITYLFDVLPFSTASNICSFREKMYMIQMKILACK